MTEFSICVAGIVASVKANYDSTQAFCAEYLCSDAPKYNITITEADIAFERQKSEREDEIEGIAPRQFSDAYLETIAVQRKLAEHLFAENTLLFHGSVIAVDSEAFLFTAKSGTGKSTHTRLWRQVFGDRAVMINDDKPFLKLTNDGVVAYGSPWNGKHHLGSNTSAPLKAICILERGTENSIAEITPKEALPMLLQQSHRPMRMTMMPVYLDLIDRLSRKVRFYRLSCTMDQQAAVVAYEGMTSKRKEDER